ncbi:type II toxin-antitoxin system RelE/ParE family toxin [Agromyces sp. NPDC058484]|uniref:type II toxin-antitoxin system RelE family toxin n=1 Tax=Agromyces sp. NPDC058484 TaxID=3346524 RepID=UPI003664FDDA
MAYSVEYTETALKQLRKLDRQVARRIVGYLDDVAGLEEPRDRGKGLVGDRVRIWRYRVGDYRVLCELIDSELVILAIAIAHRREIYDD